MSKFTKIIVTVVVCILFFGIFAVIVGVRESSGHSTPGILGLILFAGLIGAIRAIWKKGDNSNNDNDTTSILQK